MAIANLNGARERAEELLQNLQKRARTVWDSEAASNMRSMIDEKGKPARRALDETVAKVKANPMVNEAERLVGRLLESSPVASKADLEEMGKQVKSLNKKLNELAKKIGDNAQTS